MTKHVRITSDDENTKELVKFLKIVGSPRDADDFFNPMDSDSWKFSMDIMEKASEKGTDINVYSLHDETNDRADFWFARSTEELLKRWNMLALERPDMLDPPEKDAEFY